MKKINFIIQAKGGSGKSMLSYLLALKNENNEGTYYVDLDSSVQSSFQQLKFLQGKKPSRFGIMSLLDSRNKIDRQMMFDNLHDLSQKEYETFYMDFGAPESDQFPSLFSADYNIAEFKQIESELGCQFIFNVVVAGGGAYQACTTYLKRIVGLVDGHFEVNIYINQGTFLNYPHLIREIEDYAASKKNKITGIKLFGDFDETTIVHKNILQIIEQGKGIEAYKFIQKIKILKELSKL